MTVAKYDALLGQVRESDLTEDLVSYGIEIDTALAGSTSALKRIGSMDMHRNLYIQNQIKGCIQNDNGAIVRYLNPLDWTSETRDGSLGQVMVELPAHYRKFNYPGGTIIQPRISQIALPGYHFVPKMYMSAYEASLQHSTGKLCSVVNAAADYRGGNNTSAWDGTYRSLLGRGATNLSRGAFRTAARLRNTANTSWNCQDYNAYNSMFWLYMIEYANTNSQLAVNASKDAAGLTQGGLGTGVTDWDGTWSTWNSYNPFVPCGHTDSLGNRSGEVAYAIKDTDGTTTIKTVKANRYRGIENPFGHIWKWTDGVNIETLTAGSGGTTKCYVATDPAVYNDSNYVGYTNRGLLARGNGYISKLLIDQFGDILPSETSGGSTTGWCDYFWTDIGSDALRGFLSGGGADLGASCGLASAAAHYAPSGANTHLGSRLCFIPA